MTNSKLSLTIIGSANKKYSFECICHVSKKFGQGRFPIDYYREMGLMDMSDTILFECEIIKPALWDTTLFPKNIPFHYSKKYPGECYVPPINGLETITEMQEYLKTWCAGTVFIIEHQTSLEKELLTSTDAQEYNNDGNLISYFQKWYNIVITHESKEFLVHN